MTQLGLMLGVGMLEFAGFWITMGACFAVAAIVKGPRTPACTQCVHSESPSMGDYSKCLARPTPTGATQSVVIIREMMCHKFQQR